MLRGGWVLADALNTHTQATGASYASMIDPEGLQVFIDSLEANKAVSLSPSCWLFAQRIVR